MTSSCEIGRAAPRPNAGILVFFVNLVVGDCRIVARPLPPKSASEAVPLMKCCGSSKVSLAFSANFHGDAGRTNDRRRGKRKSHGAVTRIAAPGLQFSLITMPFESEVSATPRYRATGSGRRVPCRIALHPRGACPPRGLSLVA